MVGEALAVRRAVATDEATLLRWRNDPWIVERGSTVRAVTPAQHHAWFAETLSGARDLFILEIDGEYAGMVRYDFGADGTAEISIYLLPPYIGRGLGTDAMRRTVPDVFFARGARRILARVRHGNAPSLRFFERLGFQPIADDDAGWRLVLMRTEVPHSRPYVDAAAADRVAAVIRTRQLAQGPQVRELERRWARAVGTRGAVAVASGVAALRLALLALGIGPGDQVIVPGYSCVALFNAVLALGAEPIAADVVQDAWTLSPADVAARLTSRTKAIIAVHLFGAPADIARLGQLGVPIVEDCAHGIGGRTGERDFGQAGTISIASLYATKMLTAGEGGVAASDNLALLDRIRSARDYGDQPADGRHLNDKMTDLEAALALSQLDALDDILSRRQQRAARYARMLAPLRAAGLIVLPAPDPGRIWYRYAVRLTRHFADRISARMAVDGIRSERPVWDLRASRADCRDLGGVGEAFDHLLSLPLYPDLSDIEQALVCASLDRALRDV